ncbi:AMP-binding protein [Sandarakinorhabdus limnophila]|uniref:AMP-binding protein n=1 Tax=Sandarakinorhabdus limnophila TaxID=210512 RepID=UPI002353B833
MSMQNVEPFDGLQTLGDIARVHARLRPDTMALKFEGRTTTYGVLDAHTNRVAQALLADGTKKADRIGYLAKNSDRFFEILLGAAKIGAVTLPIGWRLAAAEIAYLLENGEVSILFVGKEFGDLAREAIAISGRQVRVIDLESERPGGYAAWRDSQDATDPAVAISAADTALQTLHLGHNRPAQGRHADQPQPS